MVRGVSVLIAPARPAYFFGFGPRFRVPLNFFALSTSASVQILTFMLASTTGLGARNPGREIQA